ncbi:MAG: S-adenosyl-l-methionine hydroxide adenosyltransferase family protein [Thermoproteus sp.]
MIALLTDFGTRDYFVAEMKAVILSINPNETIVDITHDVPPQEVGVGAFVLWRAYRWFPKGTIFVAVVDPGVGTPRAPLLLKTKNYLFVGPDNGLLSIAAEEDGVEKAYRLTVRLPEPSSTFHGRDIFAYAAALLSKGIRPDYLGVEMSEYVRLPKPGAVKEGNIIKGTLIYIDRFGNIFTSISENIIKSIADYNDLLCIKISEKIYRVKFLQTYGLAEPGEVLALVNSEGFLEIAINRGNAAERLGHRVGEPIEVYRC